MCDGGKDSTGRPANVIATPAHPLRALSESPAKAGAHAAHMTVPHTLVIRGLLHS